MNLPRGVAIILYRSRRFCISRRLKGGNYGGHHQFPGGHIEEGERTLDGALRELREETGLVPALNRLVYLGSEVAVGYKGESYEGHRYGLELFDGEEPADTEPDRQGPWFWVRMEDLKNYTLIASTAAFADDFATFLRVLVAGKTILKAVPQNAEDVTDRVEFGNPDDEKHLPITKCICGKSSRLWEESLNLGPEFPWMCPECHAELYFDLTVRVYRVLIPSA